MDEVSSSILHRKVFVARRLANVSGSWRDNKSGNSTPCPPFWEKLRELNVFPVGRGESDPDDTGTLCGSYLRNLWWSCFTERAEVPRLCFPPSLSTWADILKISIWKEELKKSALPTKKKGGNVLGESAWLVGLQNEPKRRLSLPARIVISPMFSQNEEQRISLSFELYSANWRTWRGYKTGGLEAVDSKREKK